MTAFFINTTNVTYLNIGHQHIEGDHIAAIALGDENAFSQLFYAYSDQLGAFVYKILGSREIAQEIVQDVFMKIWERRSTISEISGIGQYLYTLTRNQSYNYLRDQARASNRFKKWMQDVDQENEPLATDEVEESLEDYLPMIETAISNLPDQQRRVFELAKKQGLSYSQIASEMDISAETVKKYMKLALRSIREKLQFASAQAVILLVYWHYFHH